jgi:MarR family transcriptional regulator, transcriptional regulator for hemolysin
MSLPPLETVDEMEPGMPGEDTTDAPLAAKVLFLARLLRANLNRRLSESDATLPTWVVLAALDKDEDVSQRQLADECRLEGPTITRHLDRLEARGLVRRQRDRRDRRIVRVSFTPEGKRYYAALERAAGAVDATLRSSLSDEERAGLTSAIARLVNVL